jgi:hypothetical protein
MKNLAAASLLLLSSLSFAQNQPNHTEAGQTPSPVVKPPAPNASPVPVIALPPPASAVPIVPPPAVVPPEPIGGYSNGGFYLRDPKDWFVVFPKGRLQVDWYNFPARGDKPAGADSNGPKDPRPKDTLFVRRARVEVQGTFIGHFDFSIGGEFASTPATGAYGTLTDAWVNVDYLPYLKLQAGQFDAPFTMENRTSDKFFDFMERSIAVRAFGVPSNKDDGAMIWGWLPKHLGYYSLGVFNGDGQSFKNQDNNPAIIGRAFVAPLAWMNRNGNLRWIEDVWVGGSFWWQRNVNLGGASAPSSAGAQNDIPTMTTQGGVAFFNASYGNGTDAAMNPIRSHLAPDGDTTKWALELNVPVKKVGLRWEFVDQSASLAQYSDTVNTAAASLKRSGPARGVKLDGYSTYIELYGWILGDVNFLESPGQELPPKIKKFTWSKEPKWGLMLAAKYEFTNFSLSGLPAGPVDAMTMMATKDPAEGTYTVHTFELGLNAWGTKHVRVTANYLFNYFDGDAKNMKANFYYHKYEHELLFRIGVNI